MARPRIRYANQHEPMPNRTLVWTGTRAQRRDYRLEPRPTVSRFLVAGRTPTHGREAGDDAGARMDAIAARLRPVLLNGEAGLDARWQPAAHDRQVVVFALSRGFEVLSYDVNGAATGTDLNPYTESKRGAEFGANFDRAIGSWEMESLLLLTRGRFERKKSLRHVDRQVCVNSISPEERIAGQRRDSILRATLTRGFGPTQHVKFGLEGAQNVGCKPRADAGPGEAGRSRSVSNSNVLIEEQRVDGFVSHGWHGHERWSFDWRLAGEYCSSRIQRRHEPGRDARLCQALDPVTRRVSESNQLRLRVSRRRTARLHRLRVLGLADGRASGRRLIRIRADPREWSAKSCRPICGSAEISPWR